jgi:hypothetical protein
MSAAPATSVVRHSCQNEGEGLRRAGRCSLASRSTPRLRYVADLHREAALAKMRVLGEDIPSDFEDYAVADGRVASMSDLD